MSSKRLAIGLDTGGTNLAAGVVDEEGRVLAESHLPVERESVDSVIEQLVSVARGFIKDWPQVSAVGAGMPCTIDYKEGRVIQTVHLPLRDIPLRSVLEEALQLPVALDNDGNMAAIAEQQIGVAAGARNVVMLTIGTGIGGGAILNGEVFRGASGAAPELGHMIVDCNGPACAGACPSRGCLEACVSATAIVRMAREGLAKHPDSFLAHSDGLTSKKIFDAAQEGDKLALRVFEKAGRSLGVGLASIANIFDPECIVVGGGVMAAGEMILGPAKKELRERALEPGNGVLVVEASLGERAGMIGAAHSGLYLS